MQPKELGHSFNVGSYHDLGRITAPGELVVSGTRQNYIILCALATVWFKQFWCYAESLSCWWQLSRDNGMRDVGGHMAIEFTPSSRHFYSLMCCAVENAFM